MKCLIGGCPAEKIYSRGLCISHYAMIGNLVRRGERTWEEFEKVGMALKGTFRGPHSIKTETFRKMMKEKFPKKI